jgi:hypothetical protein
MPNSTPNSLVLHRYGRVDWLAANGLAVFTPGSLSCPGYETKRAGLTGNLYNDGRWLLADRCWAGFHGKGRERACGDRS